jgi:hypothetical protein
LQRFNSSKTDSNLDALCKKCEEVCIATECEKHSDMNIAKKDACRKCAAECKAMLEVVA